MKSTNPNDLREANAIIKKIVNEVRIVFFWAYDWPSHMRYPIDSEMRE